MGIISTVLRLVGLGFLADVSEVAGVDESVAEKAKDKAVDYAKGKAEDVAKDKAKSLLHSDKKENKD